MKIAIIGTNGMLSTALTNIFFSKGEEVYVYGLEKPDNYQYTEYIPCDLLKEQLDYNQFLSYDMVIYAAGAGVQAALSTPSELMYALNVSAPISITLGLKRIDYKGIFISFGSYMEIGVNQLENHAFNEDEVVCSDLPVTNDYALSKRLFSRYMRDIDVAYTHWHFILPNMFSINDVQPGTRLISYIIQCVKDLKAGKDAHPSFSAGTQVRQFILLEELYNVMNASLAHNLQSGVYCVGGGEVLKIRELIQRIFKFYSIPCEEAWFGKEQRRDNDIQSLILSGERLNSQISYLPNKKVEYILPVIDEK